MKRKRVYTHRKGRMMPLEHGSVLDEMDRSTAGTPLSPYKTRKKRASLF